METREVRQLKEIIVYTEEVLSGDMTGHNMDHIYRVVRSAEMIQKREGGDEFIVLAGAYLHDVMDDKLVESPKKARIALHQLLQGIGVSEEQIKHLFEVIDNVSFSHGLEQTEPIELSLEAKIVQDADRLDALGAIGIGRTFYYGGKKGHTMHDPNILPREQMTKEDYRVNQTVINHFYEKLFKLPDLLQTEAAREEAEKRTQLMKDFVTAFETEWG